MENEKISLNICDLFEISNYGNQQCQIPNEYISIKNLEPLSLVLCKTEKNEQFLCRLTTQNNYYPEQYCFLDDSVQVGISNFQPRIGKQIVDIQPVNEEIVNVKNINIRILITENFFNLKISKCILEYCIRSALSLRVYYQQKCTVRLDRVTNILGIDCVFLTSNASGPYKIDNDTIVIIDDIIVKNDLLKFVELAGMHQVDLELIGILKDFRVQKNIQWKLRPSLNTLIIGPPGSGKTAICHNFFIRNKCNVISIRPADIIRQYPGETEQELRKIANNVKYFVNTFKSTGLTVVFIEDIDILCPSVLPQSDAQNMARISSQIYSILDDFYSCQTEVIFFGTTSKIDNVNIQLRRPGRFEKEIQIHIPNTQERLEILQLLLKSTPIENQINKKISKIVESTAGFVGGDLKLLIQNILQSIFLKFKSFEIDDEKLEDIICVNVKMARPISIKSSDIKVYKCQETFDDIGGFEDLKKRLEVSVLTPLKKPEVFKKFGLKLPKGILFYGPPGCAKTTIAKCLANETGLTFISISAAEVYSPYVGQAEKYISKIFDTARRNSPCLIFFDEIETLVGKRTQTTKSDVQTRILSALLQEMDGIGLKIDEGIKKTNEKDNHILVIGATNRPDMIDDALIRPGRFDKLIHVPAPNIESRYAILNLCGNRMPFATGINLKNLAEKTEYFSGADLCNLCNEAALHSLTRDFNSTVIEESDFDFVLKTLKPSLTIEQIDWYKNFENEYYSK